MSCLVSLKRYGAIVSEYTICFDIFFIRIKVNGITLILA